MNQPNERDRWKQDEAVLARIGAVVFTQNTEVEIRLSRTLADEAVSAWQRGDEVIVRLDAWLVGDALSTADDVGALEQ